MPYILPFGQAHGDQAWRTGPKAARLSQLHAAGFPVPDGFAVATDALDLFLDDNGLRPLLAQALATERDDLVAVLASWRQTVQQSALPKTLDAELRPAYERLAAAVSVRSSSTLEDRADLSFAGQHDSFLNLTTYAACVDALKRVWASLWSDRALAYLNALGRDTSQLQMGVVVQTLVPADAAGVCFTVHPVSGAYEQVHIAAGPGLGEGTVSGQASPDEAVVGRQPRQVLSYEIGAKAAAVRLDPAGGTRIEDLDAAARQARLLDDAQALAVADLALRVEAHWGGDPQDTEWAFAGDALYLLQARPMVVAAGNAWQSPIPGAHWKRNWRLGEWLPDPVTPLFATWVLPKLVAAREQFGTGRLGWDHHPSFSMPHPWFCLVNGYFYTRQDFPGWGKDDPPNETAEEKAARQKRQRREQQKKGIAFRRDWHERLIPAYLEHFKTHRRAFEQATPAALLERVEILAEEAGEIWYVIAPIGYGFEEMGFKPRYEELIPEADRPHYTELLSGYPSRVIDGQQALYELAQKVRQDPDLAALFADGVPAAETLPDALRRDLDAYAAEYGHQLRSMDFFFPTSGEDTAQTLSMLRTLVRHEGRSPKASRKQTAEKRDRAVAAVLTQLSVDSPERQELAELIEYYQTNASIREDANFYLQLGWPLMRRALLHLADRLVDAGALDRPEALFFLEKDELRGAVAALERGEKLPSLAAVAAGRQRTWQDQRALEAPDALPLEEEQKKEGEEEEKGYIDDGDGRRFVARAASPGLYRGRVRLVRSDGEPQTLEEGEVLVTYTASPALTPLLLVAGALVVDIGGGASHSSLVARELGLPAVVNTVTGTRVLKDGMEVEVDGTRGVVRIIEG